MVDKVRNFIYLSIHTAMMEVRKQMYKLEGHWWYNVTLRRGHETNFSVQKQ
jgi:hypothetical protein